jgi:hypothetical protein
MKSIIGAVREKSRRGRRGGIARHPLACDRPSRRRAVSHWARRFATTKVRLPALHPAVARTMADKSDVEAAFLGVLSLGPESRPYYPIGVHIIQLVCRCA